MYSVTKLMAIGFIAVILSGSLVFATEYCTEYRCPPEWQGADNGNTPPQGDRWVGYTICFNSSMDDLRWHDLMSGSAGDSVSNTFVCSTDPAAIFSKPPGSVEDHHSIDFRLEIAKTHDSLLLLGADGWPSASGERAGDIKNLTVGNCTAFIDNMTRPVEYKTARVRTGEESSMEGTRYLYSIRGYCCVAIQDQVALEINTAGCSPEESIEVFKHLRIDTLYGDTTAFYLDKARNDSSLEEALDDYGNAIKISGGSPEARKGRFLTLYEMGRYEEAAKEFPRILGDSPSSDWHIYVSTLEKLNRTDQAEYAVDQENRIKASEDEQKKRQERDQGELQREKDAALTADPQG